MTALPTAMVPTAPVRPRRADRGANARPRPAARSGAGPRSGAWVHVPRSSSNVEVATALALQAPPAPIVRLREETVRVVRVAAPAEPRYEWTPRGLAVLLALVAVVFVVMGSTLVSAFLAVSDAPLPPSPAAAVVAVR